MYKKSKLNTAIVAAVAGCAASDTAYAAQLEEIIVTATKRSESAQSVPVAVQALGGESLEALNVSSFDDYVKYLPNVTKGGRGPGQNEIYVRGQAADAITISVAEAQGSAPNVALYVDEQPVTSGGRNLDIYITDIERVEVLGGPQGTLFGASSMAGTVRIITNKPDLNKFSAGIDIGVASTTGGEMSNSTEAYINIPLIEDKLAVRVAAFNDNQGGYIDNEFATLSLADYDLDSINTNSTFYTVPTDGSIDFERIDNQELAEDDFNDATYQGARIGVKYAINDEWDFLIQHTTQALNTQGVWDYDPAVGDLKVERFFKDELEDELSMTTWTLQGRMAALDLVYTGGYVGREVTQSYDYTDYNNVSAFVGGYTCSYDTSAFPYVATECFSPVKAFYNDIKTTRQTHEFRISTDQDNALRLTAGIYYDDSEILSDGTFYYQGVADGYNAAIEAGNTPNYAHLLRDPFVLTGAAPNEITLIDPSTRLPGEGYINDITRTEEQIAVFGELSYDMTDAITATVGLRYYDIEAQTKGWSAGQFRFAERNLDNKPVISIDDVIPKFSVSYTPSDDALFYATYSEGFRPPGVNRAGGEPANNAALGNIPDGFESDEVKNIEFGWKTDMLDGSLRWNGTIYSVEWTDIQIARFDPTNLTITTFIDNAVDADILGVESDLTYAVNDSLTLFAALSYNDTEIVNLDAGSIIANVLPPEGSPLPLTPELQYNIRLRHEAPIGNFDGFWQFGMVYADDTVGALLVDDALPQQDYTIFDASAGISRDDWRMEFYIENLSDERAQLHHNQVDDIPRITTNRPRTMGLRFSYDFE